MTQPDRDEQQHPVIWLQPWCDYCARVDRSDTGRTWCVDNVYDRCECGRYPVKYVLAETKK